MADSVQLNVMLNGAEQAIASLAQIDAYAKSLGNKTVKVTVSSTGITRAANQAEKLNTNLVNAAKAGQQIGTAVPQGMGKAAKTTEEAAKSAKNFSLGIGSVVGNMIKIQAVNAAINGTVRAVKFAVNEMKAVDTEMVNIRKVTGFSADEMDRLSKSAYSLATQYGRTASEVLQGGTTFARAGYTDQIEQLSELSLLLQNVGDLQAEDASKFIVATDKAYKLGGSYESLMAIIDGLDNITNRNATDMQKMTDGMTIAGSVFAESGESVETFAALLGTATANTQRSGSEVARGLRTILMNLRQIRGETEDGELIDGESIAAASKALKEYAGISTMENGQLRLASDVLAELAGKWGELTETQRAAIAEAVAGKRQANILMSLMGDYGSVEKMLREYQTGAGTAARENAAYMESWAAKTEQVKAAWTELVQRIVNSDTIINFLGGVVDVLNDINDAMDPEGTAKERREELEKQYEALYGQNGEYQDLISRQGELNELERQRLAYLQQQMELRQQEIKDAKQAEFDAYQKTKGSGKTSVEWDAASNSFVGTSADIKNVENFRASLAALNDEFAKTKDWEAYNQGLQTLQNNFKGTREELESYAEQGFADQFSEAQKQLLESLSVIDGLTADSANGLDAYSVAVAAFYLSLGQSVEEAAAKAKEAKAEFTAIPTKTEAKVTADISGAQGPLDTVLGWLSKIKEGATAFVKVASQSGGGVMIPQFASGTRSAPGGASLVNEKGPEIISANGLAWIAGGGAPTIAMLPKGATVLNARDTRRAMRGGRIDGTIPAYESGTKTVDIAGITDKGIEALTNALKNFGSAIDETRQELTGNSKEDLYTLLGIKGRKGMVMYDQPIGPGLNDWDGAAKHLEGSKTGTGAGTGSGTGGSGGGTAAPDFKTLEKELDDRLKNLDLQAKLAENQEDFLKAMQIYGEAQDYISELLDTYRAAGYAEDSTEVLKLANMGYDYASKQLGGYDDLQQRLIDALNALTEATEDENELMERQEAVDKAREALKNAESQRTVRVFNPVTGQWEWIANASDIQRVQESLQNAEKSLKDEELRQALESIQNAKPEDLAGMTLAPALIEKIQEGTQAQQEAFLRALDGTYGGASYLGSSETVTPFHQGAETNIGNQYNFGDISLTDEQAASMTVKQLVETLRGTRLM